MICQYRVTNGDNKCATLGGDVCSAEAMSCVCAGRGVEQSLFLPPNFAMALKLLTIFLKKPRMMI